jgi:putative chitinase
MNLTTFSISEKVFTRTARMILQIINTAIMLNRKNFFDSIRHSLFEGRIKAKQVEGIEIILNKWEKEGYKDLRWLAYILATVFHETAHTMQPVQEFGRGKGRKYGEPAGEYGHAYYGRGYCQLTWEYNYLRFSKMIGVDIYQFPEKACEPAVAVDILFIGMIRGMFTGKPLAQYFNDDVTDWVGARRIVNSLDRADMIGNIATKFHYALL